MSETVHSTILPVERVPSRIFMAPPKTLDPEEIRAAVKRPAPYILHNKQLITFENLKKEGNAFALLTNPRQTKEEKAARWWHDPDKNRLYVYLLGRCLNKITGSLGLMLDREHDRYYFTTDAPNTERKVRYRPLNMDTSEISVVWQPIQKSRGEPYGYWLHRAVSCRFILVSSRQWLLALRPEFHVTTNGRDDYESSEIGAKVTHKKSHMYNHDLLSEVNFWRAFLSGGQPRIVLRFGQQSLVIGTTLVQTQVSWPGVPDDVSPFKNVIIPENLFSLREVDGLSDDNLEEDWEEEEEADDVF